MGYDISEETYQRIERYKAQGRLCQGSGRCSQRGNRLAVILLEDDGPNGPEARWSIMVVCGKHAAEMTAWPSFVNGAMLRIAHLDRSDKAPEIATLTKLLEAEPIRPVDIVEAHHRMRVDEAKRAAWSAR